MMMAGHIPHSSARTKAKLHVCYADRSKETAGVEVHGFTGARAMIGDADDWGGLQEAALHIPMHDWAGLTRL